MLLETLERRSLLTVTVNQGYPGYFEITGDANDNEIAVSVSQNNYYFVLDNITYFDVMYIAIDGGGGNDTISVTSFDGPGYIAAAVQGGIGNDTIDLGIPGGVWGGDGDDDISLTDSYRGEVYGEAGSDSIHINGENVGAEIRGGIGNDLIEASNSTMSVTLYGGDGNDTITGSVFDDQIYGDNGADLLIGGGGNDTYYTDSSDTIGESGGGLAYSSSSSEFVSSSTADTDGDEAEPFEPVRWFNQLRSKLRLS